MLSKWEVRIGLEIHAQISSLTKLFSAASTSSKDKIPNSSVSLFDAAIPGTLPSLNRQAVQHALRTAIALKCNINKYSIFERKHYFYQDLPLGYQITQHKHPIAENGILDFPVLKDGKEQYRAQVGITRIQIEQDSGKSLHENHPSRTLVDLNRAGTGLLEIVFEPTLTSADEAASALRSMQMLLRHINVCDGNLQDGSMRCDVNVSVHKDNEIKGKRVEVKNINSMQMVTDAVNFEVQRHISLLESDRPLLSETRGYNAMSGETFHMRFKESTVDYRIFPDPDIPPLVLTDEEITASRVEFSKIEMPDDMVNRLHERYKLTNEQIEVLTKIPGLVQFYESIFKEEQIIQISSNGDITANNNLDFVVVYNWLTGDVLAEIKNRHLDVSTTPITPNQFVKVMKLLQSQVISGPQAKILFKELFSNDNTNVDPELIVSRNGWLLISDDSLIENMIHEIINDPKHAIQLQKYKDGKKSFSKYFFGEVMKKSKGQANPIVVDKKLNDILARLAS
jgi:aspartyl-tRNA(Asn)/glutamyl-tRNA(Gln) amidotransferase subunit B